ncbi:hypothetical protein AMATHDRAFT_54824 [Amanita thiersii Skay4041]|uniref:Homeobox domain-containing protein n=1 Tax=Amanita thiersii Skay4041 TaxID=703135 RepID=A0A2A9NSV1_9AGAR|nr:hypothetical protein AMATHDRAFT_54824 [Amanita thiersii Skay4041]
MAKRLRRSSDIRPRPPVSLPHPSCDSQDNPPPSSSSSASALLSPAKQDSFPSPQPPQPPPPPPKKKRTRTLTTPHQAAVLHALLAQSRFPTTAMREEVGRSIGLSARKVQNQRQKARRPRSQSEATTTHRPPQYGAFPPGPEYRATFSARPDPAPSTSSLRHLSSGSSQSIPSSTTSVSTPESYSSISDAPAHLLGPGVPGLDLHSRAGGPAPSATAPSITSNSTVAGASTLPQFASLDFHSISGPSQILNPSVSPTSPTRVPMYLPRPMSSHIPLQDVSPGPRAHLAAGQISYIDMVSQPAAAADHPFIHYTPVPSQGAGSGPHSTVGSSGSLPPPFTLQPPPQWDSRSFAPSLTARSSVWSRPSSRGSSLSPTHSRSHSGGPPLMSLMSLQQPPLSGPRLPPIDIAGVVPPRCDTAQSDEQQHQVASSSTSIPAPTSPVPQPRAGRYDPVRATIVPFSNMPPSQSSSSSAPPPPE